MHSNYQSTVEARANEIIAKRSASASIVYIVLFVILAFGTTLWKNHPILCLSVGILLTVFGGIRFWSSSKNINMKILNAAVFCNSLIWGGFCFVVLKEYQMTSTTLALLMATAGICSGIILTFTHSSRLSQIQLVNILIPIILGFFINDENEGILCGLLTTVYLVYMLFRAKAVSKTFIEDLRKTEIISAQKTELEKALNDAVTAAGIKNEFLSMMSHEIRTPLNGIMGLCQLLETEDNLSEEHKKSVGMIHQCGQSLLVIVNDVLDFSKVEAGKMEFEEIEFDVIECAKSSLKIFESTAQKKNLKFQLLIDPNMPKYAFGDANRVRQILMNLIGNAIKFTDRGEVIVTLGATQKSLNRYDFKFSVKDSGIGISEENFPKLFKMFSQVDSTMARRFGGTGLGLAICQKLCQLMGGTISAESTLGKGSTFSFSLPFRIASDHSRKHFTQTEATLLADTEQKIWILVGEDNSINQKIIVGLLEKFGNFHVEVRTNGVQVVDEALRTNYDLIFMDCHMPDVDGYEATKRIREMDPSKRVPIIAFTASALPGDREKCLAIGMDDYLAKPISPSELKEILQKWLGERARPRKAA